MDNKPSIVQAVAEKLGRTTADTETLLSAMCAEITRALSETETVAIPGFGSFSAHKEDEHVTTDLSTGKSVLLPPSIVAEFNPGSRLTKSLTQ